MSWRISLAICILFLLPLCGTSNDFADKERDDVVIGDSSTRYTSSDFNARRGDVVVTTSLGKIVGKRDGNVNTFLGIPYAQPPIGRLRFRPPQPTRSWHPSTYLATKFAPECLQSALYSFGTEEDTLRDEDCLYINIWAPAKKSRANVLSPVMIWIHGGAFMHGSAGKPEYIGNKLATKDVLVVSCNYRLGALGFLVSTADGLYGNYGLNDQKLAMQWVQDHIQNFGEILIE